MGYTGAKKGWCFKNIKYMSSLKQYVFLSNLIPFFKKSVKKWDSAGQKLFRGGGLKGGLKKNGCPQIVISLKPFKTIFMSWDIDLGSMNSFPHWNYNSGFYCLKNGPFDRFYGGCFIFFFWWLCNPHLRWKSKFKVLNLKKITKTTYSESLKTFASVLSSV